MLGIYALEGADLKLCFDKPGEETRPSEFKSKAGSPQMCVILKREEKK